MKHYLPKQILVVNEQIQLDPPLIKYMKMLFDWANEAGLKGIKVGYLAFVPPRSDGCMSHPTCTIWCQQECTEEEEKTFRARQEEMIKHAVLSGWTDIR